MTVVYIHGFGSSGLGGKAKIFREYFENLGINFIAPTLSYIPDLAILTLEDIIKNCNDVKLIGSSLGGFYSIYLASKYDLKATLINPAINPDITLKRAIPKALNYYDLSYFDWNASYLEMLKKYKITPEKQEKYMLMLQKGDETLNYKEALNLLVNANIVLEDGGSHSFDRIDRYLDNIKDFLK